MKGEWGRENRKLGGGHGVDSWDGGVGVAI